MIPANVREEISRYVGSEARPYHVPGIDSDLESGCEWWELPAQAAEDRPVYERYQEITRQIMGLTLKGEEDARVAGLTQEATSLLEGMHVTKKHGAAYLGINDFLGRDPFKGIRKEWWELHNRFTESGVSVFLGYRTPGAAASRRGDMLIAMPDADPFEFLRINQTRGNNHPVSTEKIIGALRKMEQGPGVSVVCALPDYAEFVFERPAAPDERRRIRERLHRLCPSAEDLAGGIRLGRVSLWWD